MRVRVCADRGSYRTLSMYFLACDGRKLVPSISPSTRQCSRRETARCPVSSALARARTPRRVASPGEPPSASSRNPVSVPRPGPDASATSLILELTRPPPHPTVLPIPEPPRRTRGLARGTRTLADATWCAGRSRRWRRDPSRTRIRSPTRVSTVTSPHSSFLLTLRAPPVNITPSAR